MIPERVSHEGKLYTRRVLYTAQLYAQSPGVYKIDPITLGVSYNARSRNSLNNFGFGFNLGRLKTKSLRSKVVEVTVKALPIDGVPPSFTGLVGKHEFSLKVNKNKFITNEPIEVSLAVRGEGALELLEAPPILSSPSIEEFES